MKYVVVSAVVMLSLSVTACSDTAGPPGPEAAPVRVTVSAAAVQELPEPFEAGGVVRARTVAQVVSRIMAAVESVRVSPGDRVRAGQPLVVLDGRDLQANRARGDAARAAADQSAALAAADVEAADAALHLARLTFDRIKGLRDAKSATQQEFDEAETQLKAAEARRRVAAARVAEAQAGVQAAAAAASAAGVTASFATLVAPFDGLVTEKLVEQGNMASPGMPLVTVEDTRGFRLDVRLDESRAGLVKVADDVRVVVDSPIASAGTGPASFSGRVVEIARMLDPGSHDFLVKIEFADAAGLKSGMYARAVFQGPSHRALAVPAGSVLRRGQLSFVYVVENSRAHLRLVNAAQPVDGLVEVRSGLLEGERVVSDPPAGLDDGQPVTTGETSR